MIEGFIAVICFAAFLFIGDIEILKTCGIFVIASYLGMLNNKNVGDRYEINFKNNYLFYITNSVYIFIKIFKTI